MCSYYLGELYSFLLLPKGRYNPKVIAHRRDAFEALLKYIDSQPGMMKTDIVNDFLVVHGSVSSSSAASEYMSASSSSIRSRPSLESLTL